jgi:3',5'-cyclic AMP phosphodiesterase CpdA
MRRIVHLSDLHFCRISFEVLWSLKERVREIHPDLVVVSGDLTQRARAHEFQAAAQFLKSLPGEKLVVPGNHDVPLYNPYMRFFKPFHRYRAHITDDLCPIYEDEKILVIGVTTARSFTLSGGRLGRSRLSQIASQLDLASSKLKIVVSHHPLELFDKLKFRGPKANRVRAHSLLKSEPDLLLSGHLHKGTIRHSGAVAETQHRSLILVQAGTASSTRLRSEKNSFNLICLEGNKAEIIKHTHSEGTGTFLEAERQVYVRDPRGWLAARLVQ